MRLTFSGDRLAYIAWSGPGRLVVVDGEEQGPLGEVADLQAFRHEQGDGFVWHGWSGES
jgi:hypothetical protein